MTRNEKIRQEALKWKTDDNEFIAQTAFEAGAWWADEHPQSPWKSIEDRLPEPHETVLVYGFFTLACSTAIEAVAGCELNRRFTEADQKRMGRSAHGMFDKYGFPNHGNPKYVVRYWMPIPDFPKDV